mgnify:FL=1
MESNEGVQNELIKKISVIIITKNEEHGIQRCFDSVINELMEFKDWEIILVDSNSTDNTLQIAKNYPCKIYRIKGNNLSASLGRYVGTKYAKGEYILYLDGDMELCPGWLNDALKKLESDVNAAGIIGIRSDIVYDKDLNILKRIPNYYNIASDSIANHFGGAFLARKKIIEQVGGYDPRLPSNEEPELHSRILNAGYYILQNTKPMIVHHDIKARVTFFGKLKTLYSKRSLGLGLAFKYSFYNRNLKSYFLRMNDFLIPIFLDIISCLFIIFLIIIPFGGKENYFWLVFFFQTISLLYSIYNRSGKRYLQSKVLFVNFIIGLLYKVDLKYEVEKIL